MNIIQRLIILGTMIAVVITLLYYTPYNYTFSRQGMPKVEKPKGNYSIFEDSLSPQSKGVCFGVELDDKRLAFRLIMVLVIGAAGVLITHKIQLDKFLSKFNKLKWKSTKLNLVISIVVSICVTIFNVLYNYSNYGWSGYIVMNGILAFGGTFISYWIFYYAIRTITESLERGKEKSHKEN